MSKRVLGLDVSTKTIGIAIFENNGKLLELTHISPKVKPKQEDKNNELMLKSNIFKEYIKKYKNANIQRIIIEEPLLYSNNVNTVGILTKFNGLISRICYDMFGILPEYVSTYDARKFAYPELMGEGKNGKVVLFGGMPLDIDKKKVIWEKVKEREPQIDWSYTKPTSKRESTLKKENFDMSDAYTVVLGVMKRDGFWK